MGTRGGPRHQSRSGHDPVRQRQSPQPVQRTPNLDGQAQGNKVRVQTVTVKDSLDSENEERCNVRIK